MGLAGLGLPTSNSHLARVMAAARVPQAEVWAANPRMLQERLLRLKDLGLAETTRQGYWVCADRALESAARMAFEEATAAEAAGEADGPLGSEQPVVLAPVSCKPMK